MTGALDPGFWSAIADATVVDFGCGYGEGTIELARRGAGRVIGIDIRPEVLVPARERASRAGVADRCEFTAHAPSRLADYVVSIDAFEHFSEPAAVLKTMANTLVPGGRVIASFGPTWYHPRGGHLFSVFPWAHLLFSEAALCRWRRDFRSDGAMRFAEVEGGLNRMTIRRFERLVAESPLTLERLHLRPIRAARFLHGRWSREFLTSVVDCVLVKRATSY
ncbi:class I SAM-dependent methyltransferase [Roseiconus nitratireducens]|uniref:class I SAM-dependent methyltransferase n=1 Tax=Roseiconus nitratireducens TaxID=2605748 RepID=UPI0013760174|nr:class I SAM-dependent methyltransferase [Roseiconus nitratireducens]